MRENFGFGMSNPDSASKKGIAREELHALAPPLEVRTRRTKGNGHRKIKFVSMMIKWNYILHSVGMK